MKLNILLFNSRNGYKYCNSTFLSNRRYFSNKSELPKPILIIDNLTDKNFIKSYRELLNNKAGIYSLINTSNSNQYIGSAKNLYIRLLEHITGKK